MGYNAAGDITSWQQQAGANTPVVYGFTYDGADELIGTVKTSSTGGAALDSYGYRYDPAGNRLGQQLAVSGTTTVTSSVYNNLNQMTNVSGASGLVLAISGSLSEPGTVSMSGVLVATDSNNNFTIVASVASGSNSFPITTTSSGANAAQTNKTLKVNVTGGTSISPLSYDANGNLTTAGTTNYVYDAANRLVKIWYGAAGSSASSTFGYDGLGHRVQIMEANSSGVVTSTKNLIWDGSAIREERNASNAVTKLYFSNGVQISGSNYYYTRDHLGSIREVTGTNGSVLARYDYDPYGVQTLVSGTMTVDFGYAGYYFHQPSGLLMPVNREYLPQIGRWTSRDPLGEYGGINLYEYVRNDPIRFLDPLGLYDYNSQETQQQFLGPAYNGATSGILSGLNYIYDSSTGLNDFGHNRHSGDTFCVNGKRLDANQFGNYIAGFKGEAYDEKYWYSPVPALAVVTAAGIDYHMKAYFTQNPGYSYATNDPFDTTGIPDIMSGAWNKGAPNSSSGNSNSGSGSGSYRCK